MRWEKMLLVMGLIGLMALGSGCQPWQKKYQSCNAELENLKALFDSAQQSLDECKAGQNQLSSQLADAQRNLASERQKPERQASTLEKEGGVYDASRGTITVTLENEVLFDSGRVTLKSDAKSRLGRIADIIQREHQGKEVWVVGHTDTDPIKKSKWADNWQLSTERALAVTRYLIEKGVGAKQLVAAGRSQYQPIGSSKAKNRRVEIVVNTL